MPLFGKSAVQRYEELGGIQLSSYCDQPTYLMLEKASVDAIAYCDRVVGFPPGKEAVWQPAVRRLVVDGYFLGRVEEKTEKDSLRFSTAALNIDEPEKVFALLCIGTIKDATSGERFTATAPRDQEIGEMLRSFSKESGAVVLESIGDGDDDPSMESVDWKRFGSMLSASIHLGREIAINEGYFLNPKKRKGLPEVFEALREASAEGPPE